MEHSTQIFIQFLVYAAENMNIFIFRCSKKRFKILFKDHFYRLLALALDFEIFCQFSHHVLCLHYSVSSLCMTIHAVANITKLLHH